jgi:DNA-binding LytR/AlgR family response regulator
MPAHQKRLDNQPHAPDKSRRFVFIRSEYKIIQLKYEDILFCEGMKDYTRVHLTGKSGPILTLQNLKSFLSKLPEDEFIRVRRSYIVSLSHIDSIARNVIFIGRKAIPIGSRFKDQFFRIVEYHS